MAGKGCARLTLVAALALMSATATPIILDSTTAAHEYDGHGGLSAGASSRLLKDYAPSIASDILDMLFKPQWGLNLHTLKVEIGGDTDSTDGTEPSHWHNRDEPVNCSRGYETWLLSEAKKRNPSIRTYGLSWGTPGWIGNGSYFTPDQWAYQTAWVACVNATLGFTVDYLGVWNERSWGGPAYVSGLRASLDAAGFASTRIILPDGGYDPAIMADAASDPTFNASFYGVGLHYPCDEARPEVNAGGKAFWSSEHWWENPDWPGAGCWGHLLNQNYVRMNHTATIAWSPLWGVYNPGLPYQEAGLIRAREPWSGHWDISPPIWTGAQWTQFTEPGWRFLHVPGGGSGFLPGKGTYVTLVPPDGQVGMTLILETLVGACRCAQDPIAGPQTVTFILQGSQMPGPGSPLHVWMTTEADPFVQQPDLTVGQDGSITVTIPVDAMVTVTTVGGGRKGQPSVPIPPSAPFPLPYSDTFDSYGYDGMARYWADMWGSFAVREGALSQVVVLDPGPNAWIRNDDPLTMLGDATWTDVTITVNVSVTANSNASTVAAVVGPQGADGSSSASPRRSGRGAVVRKGEPYASPLQDGVAALLLPCDASSPYQRWVWDVPATGYLSNTPPPGPGSLQQCLNVYSCETKVVYWSCVTTGGTCCGGDCYQNLQWSLDGQGRLVSALHGSTTCVTAAPGGTSLTMEPCASTAAANQTWTYTAGTQQLELAGSGLCLSQPIPPVPRTYAQVCGRMASLDLFDAPPRPTGYCLSLGLDGKWNITTENSMLAGGAAPSNPITPGSWHTLSLSFSGTTITAAVDGVTVANLQDSTYVAGYVALGSGYHPARFDGFSVVPTPASGAGASDSSGRLEGQA